MITQPTSPTLQGLSAIPQHADQLLAGFLAYEARADAPAADTSSGPASTGAVEAPPPPMPECMSLSPDALMTYCETRLNSLDSQVAGIFNQQQQNATLTTDVNAVAASLNELPAPNTNTPPAVTVSDPSTIEAAYNQAINDAGGPNTQLGSSLNKDLTTFESEVKSGNGSITSDKLSQLTENLKNYTGDLNSNSEMTMINLQSLMSQRETAVQLTTNLVQSLGQQASDITKNIGT